MNTKNLIFLIIIVFLSVGGFLTYRYLFEKKISCESYLDCPSQMKCENFVCVDVGCIEEGQRIPRTAISPEGFESIKHLTTECCKGLTIITHGDSFDENCNLEFRVGVTGGGVCSNCGNGICEEWETKCNCSKDCTGNNVSPLDRVKDDKIKSSLYQVLTLLEMVLENDGIYTSVCVNGLKNSLGKGNSSNYDSQLTAYQNDIEDQGGIIIPYADKDSYCIYVKLVGQSGWYYCIDSTGFAGATDSEPCFSADDTCSF